MGTPVQTVIDAFFNRIEKDRDFFNYFNLTDSEAAAIAERRSNIYFSEALRRLIVEGVPSVDFTPTLRDDDDYEGVSFDYDLTAQELNILPSLMYESYLSRDMSYLKTLSVNYTATDLRVFDPSNARSTFMNMYQSVCERNAALIDRYRNTDRKTNEYIGIDYSKYYAEEA